MPYYEDSARPKFLSDWSGHIYDTCYGSNFSCSDKFYEEPMEMRPLDYVWPEALDTIRAELGHHPGCRCSECEVTNCWPEPTTETWSEDRVEADDPIGYSISLDYVMSSENQARHGYPMPVSGQPGLAVVAPSPPGPWVHPEDPGDFKGHFRRCCCRCRKTFTVKSDGQCVTPEVCLYHWGKLVSGVFTCCNRSASSPCTFGLRHFEDGKRYGTLKDFEETRSGAGHIAVLALDCEMCFTAHGLRVCRVTVVGSDGGTVFDALIQPEEPILDYNTKFSGLTEEDMADVTNSLEDVRRELLTIIGAETILVGHALDNDLVGLRLCHGRVVDTAHVFPHERGLPYKRSLRELAAAVLQREVQAQNHDSGEDARTCLDLLRAKIDEDPKNHQHLNVW